MGGGPIIKATAVVLSVVAIGASTVIYFKDYRQIQSIKCKNDIVEQICVNGDGLISVCSAKLSANMGWDSFCTDCKMHDCSHSDVINFKFPTKDNILHRYVLDDLITLCKKPEEGKYED